MFTHKTQPAQSVVLIAFALVGLIAITAVAVDGGNAYAERRRAQSAADDAALAGALALINNQNYTDAVHSITQVSPSNNFPDSTVSIHVGSPFTACDGSTINITHVATRNDKDSPAYYIQVMIRSSANTFFGQIIGINQMNYCVQAIARAKPPLLVPPFDGNAVVGLDPNGDSYDSGQSNASHWKIKGGGIFANHNAHAKNADSVEFPDGDCVTAVGSTSGFGCTPRENNPDLFYNYPDDIAEIMPPTPACDGTATKDTDTGKVSEEDGTDGSVWDGGFAGDYAPGLYCITDAGGNIHSEVSGVGVTFYIVDTDFTMKFNGGGAFAAQAPMSGDYAGILIFSPLTDTPCTQNMEIRGNGSTPILGTIFMPSACLDYRGNGTGDTTDSMMVGYDVTSNGNAEVHVSYNPDDNYKVPQPPIIELTK
jgi:hypothetical protein